MVFQVTKSGYESSAAMLERDDSDVRLEDDETWVEREVRVEREVMLEEDDEAVGDTALSRRDMAGTRDGGVGSSSPSASVMSASWSCESSSPLYSIHSSSTWLRGSGLRRSKLAASVSKQYAQCE